MDEARALESTYTEGVLAQVTGGIVDHYLAPCALFLGASAAQIGWLGAAPRLAAAAAQLSSGRAARAAGDRRSLLIAGAALQGLALLPVVLAALHPGPAALVGLFAAALGYQLLGGFMYPAWASLVSEYLPAERRSRFFGRRNRLLAGWGLGALAFWGLVLDEAGPWRTGLAFAALFACAAACRLVSTRWLAELSPRPLPAVLPPRERFDGAFGRLVLYAAAASFATQLGDAMQPVRLLGELRCGYRAFMLVRLSGGLGAFLSAAWWGENADRRGPARLLRAAGLLMVIAPLAWALTERLWIIAAFEVLDGAAGAGFALCAVNHLYDAVPEGGRLRAVGFYTVAVGAAVFAGGGLSGTLVGHGIPIPGLFAAAAGLRLAVELSLGGRLREARPVSAPGLLLESA